MQLGEVTLDDRVGEVKSGGQKPGHVRVMALASGGTKVRGVAQEGSPKKGFIKAVAGEAQGPIYEEALLLQATRRLEVWGAGLGPRAAYRRDVKGKKRGQRDEGGAIKNRLPAPSSSHCSHLGRHTPPFDHPRGGPDSSEADTRE